MWFELGGQSGKRDPQGKETLRGTEGDESNVVLCKTIKSRFVFTVKSLLFKDYLSGDEVTKNHGE